MVNNQMLRDKLTEIQAKTEEDKKWWEEERKSIQTKFMKELDEDTSNSSITKASAEAPDKVGNSDEDAVMVESGGPASGTSTPSGGTTKKKKKGKK